MWLAMSACRISLPDSKRSRRARTVLSATTASECFGQPNSLNDSAALCLLPVKPDLRPGYLCQDRQTVLNLQSLDFSVSQVRTIANQRAPRGMKRIESKPFAGYRCHCVLKSISMVHKPRHLFHHSLVCAQNIKVRYGYTRSRWR